MSVSVFLWVLFLLSFPYIMIFITRPKIKGGWEYWFIPAIMTNILTIIICVKSAIAIPVHDLDEFYSLPILFGAIQGVVFIMVCRIVYQAIQRTTMTLLNEESLKNISKNILNMLFFIVILQVIATILALCMAIGVYCN